LRREIYDKMKQQEKNVTDVQGLVIWNHISQGRSKCPGAKKNMLLMIFKNL